MSDHNKELCNVTEMRLLKGSIEGENQFFFKKKIYLNLYSNVKLH